MRPGDVGHVVPSKSCPGIALGRFTASGGGGQMPGNRGVGYKGPGKVAVVDLAYPDLTVTDGPGVNPRNVGREVPHGAILKSGSTNLCASDQHMVRGRTTAPEGLVLGHEITGEVVEV